MNPGERVLKALNGKETDRPPFICPGGMLNMVTLEAMQRLVADWPRCHFDAVEMSRLAIGVRELTGIENLGVPFCMTVEAEAMGAKVTMGTKKSEPRLLDYPLKKLDQFESLSGLNQINARMASVVEAIDRLSGLKTPYPTIANLTGPVSLATALIDPMDFYKALGKTPALVHEFMQFLTENLIVFGRLMLKAGAQVLTLSDPAASGEILGPRRFEAYALPYLNRILDALQEDYQASLVHICGNLKAVFLKLKKLHTKAISIDSATSINAMSTALGSDQVIVGNVSTYLLMKGKPANVRRASKVSLKRGARILSPACGIGYDTPLANMRAMAKTVRSCCWK